MACLYGIIVISSVKTHHSKSKIMQARTEASIVINYGESIVLEQKE